MAAEFHKGQRVEFFHEGVRCWCGGGVVQRIVYLMTHEGERFYRYVVGFAAEGGRFGAIDVPQEHVRRPDTRRHSTRVLRMNKIRGQK